MVASWIVFPLLTIDNDEINPCSSFLTQMNTSGLFDCELSSSVVGTIFNSEMIFPLIITSINVPLRRSIENIPHHHVFSWINLLIIHPYILPVTHAGNFNEKLVLVVPFAGTTTSVSLNVTYWPNLSISVSFLQAFSWLESLVTVPSTNVTATFACSHALFAKSKHTSKSSPESSV